MWSHDPSDHFLPLEWYCETNYSQGRKSTYDIQSSWLIFIGLWYAPESDVLLLNYVDITSTVSQHCQCIVIIHRVIIPGGTEGGLLQD